MRTLIDVCKHLAMLAGYGEGDAADIADKLHKAAALEHQQRHAESEAHIKALESSLTAHVEVSEPVTDVYKSLNVKRPRKAKKKPVSKPKPRAKRKKARK